MDLLLGYYHQLLKNAYGSGYLLASIARVLPPHKVTYIGTIVSFVSHYPARCLYVAIIVTLFIWRASS